MSNRSLAEVYQFKSRDLIWRELRNLVAALEARFEMLEAQQTTYSDEIAKFESIGVNAINQSLAPLVEQAIERLTEVNAIFSAHSPTQRTIAEGAMQFIIPGQERLTFAPTAWVSIRVNTTEYSAGMVCQVDNWEPDTGQLDVVSVRTSGTGTYSDWLVEVTAPPNLTTTAINQSQLDNAIDGLRDELEAEIAALASSSAITDAINALRTEIIAGAPTALNTLDKLAAAIGDNETYAATITSALADKASLANVTTAVAAAVPPAVAAAIATIDGGTF